MNLEEKSGLHDAIVNRETGKNMVVDINKYWLLEIMRAITDKVEEC